MFNLSNWGTSGWTRDELQIYYDYEVKEKGHSAFVHRGETLNFRFYSFELPANWKGGYVISYDIYIDQIMVTPMRGNRPSLVVLRDTSFFQIEHWKKATIPLKRGYVTRLMHKFVFYVGHLTLDEYIARNYPIDTPFIYYNIDIHQIESSQNRPANRDYVLFFTTELTRWRKPFYFANVIQRVYDAIADPSRFTFNGVPLSFAPTEMIRVIYFDLRSGRIEETGSLAEVPEITQREDIVVLWKAAPDPHTSLQ
jgi:hypothetical protein